MATCLRTCDMNAIGDADIHEARHRTSTKRNDTCFLPRLRPLKGHERSYGSCKMKRNLFVQSSTDECKYKLINICKGLLQLSGNNLHNGIYTTKTLFSSAYVPRTL